MIIHHTWLDKISIEELEKELRRVEERLGELEVMRRELLREKENAAGNTERGRTYYARRLDIDMRINMVDNEITRLNKIRRGLINLIYLKKHRDEAVRAGIWRNLAKVEPNRLILILSTISKPEAVIDVFREIDQLGEEGEEEE